MASKCKSVRTRASRSSPRSVSAPPPTTTCTISCLSRISGAAREWLTHAARRPHRRLTAAAGRYKRAGLSEATLGASSSHETDARAKEDGVCSTPVKPGQELWEHARLHSESYDPATKNCHHFARELWNFCVVESQRTKDMPTELAQNVLMTVKSGK